MSVNLPNSFLEEVRAEIIDESSYTDNELLTFTRNSLKSVNFLLRTSHTVIDGTSLYDYTISGEMSSDFVEVLKWATIYLVIDHYFKKLISTGIGVSISLGAERVDTKTLLISVKEAVRKAQETRNQKALAYNMIHRAGRYI